ncbi:MAG: hypothetical protein HC924_00575 [Synechococcaceae cyanobacterium SM2_3_2]|nr:hypothetical protein [Synechococcaceae cyanobacterium SM2_3_2]
MAGLEGKTVVTACAGVAALCGLWGLISPNRIAAGVGTVAAGAAVALSWGSQPQSFPSDVAPLAAKTPQIPYPTLWTSRWKSQTSQQEWEWKGKATLLDLGEYVVAISRDDNAKGVYVLELKRQESQTVSGIWWFYGNQPPSGTFRGTFSPDRTHLEGAWSITQGETHNGGQWDLSLIDAEATAEGITEDPIAPETTTA